MTEENKGPPVIKQEVAIGLLVRQTLASFEEVIQAQAVAWGQSELKGSLNELLADMTTEMVRCVIATTVVSGGIKARGVSTGLCRALAEMHAQRLKRVDWAQSLLEIVELNPDLFIPEVQP